MDELTLLPGEKAPERNWVVLDKHDDDQVSFTSKGRPYQTCLFTLDPKVVNGVSYRYFKLTQTGPNSKAKNHMLMCSGLDFYGHLTACPGNDDSDDPGRLRVLPRWYDHNLHGPAPDNPTAPEAKINTGEETKDGAGEATDGDGDQVPSDGGPQAVALEQ